MSTNDLIIIFCLCGAILSVFLVMGKLSAIVKVQAESTQKLTDMIHRQNLMIGEIKSVIGLLVKREVSK